MSVTFFSRENQFVESIKTFINQKNKGLNIDKLKVGIGDDCAVISVPEKIFVSSVDTAVEGRDFVFDWHNFYLLGRKLAAANTADIVAMGFFPSGCTVSLCVSENISLKNILDIYSGWYDFCEDNNFVCPIMGGDLSLSSVFVVTVNIFGSETFSKNPVLRSGSLVGDYIVLIGKQGFSDAGLNILKSIGKCDTGNISSTSDLNVFRDSFSDGVVVSEHLAPSSYVSDVLQVFKHFEVTSMLDVSDSLSLDLWRLAKSSGKEFSIFSDSIDSYLSVFKSFVSEHNFLFGGEDHGFLATVSVSDVTSFYSEFGLVLGRVIGDDSFGGCVKFDSGVVFPEKGWDAFG